MRARPQIRSAVERANELAHGSKQTARVLYAMYERLLRVYGPQFWWPAKTRLEVIIGAYLTQNTSWRGVERSIANLETTDALTIEGLRLLSEDELRMFIRPSGYMVRKAAAIKAFVRFLDCEYAGDLQRLSRQATDILRPQLLALPGVGPETADAILLYALGHPVVVADEYLRRIAVRHGLAPERAGYAELQQLGVSALAQAPEATLTQHANELHALVVMVGKTHCGARPRCDGCPLASFPATLALTH